jgi:Rrf2 family protein
MAANSRLTIAVHALAWMALAQRRGHGLLTSDQVAASVNTNPVIIRRSLGDLRLAGLVDVRHGAGAGWSLARAPEEITLLDVYDAVEQEPIFAMHRTEPNLECPVGRGIRPALGHVYGGVERALRQELSRTTIADVLRDSLRARGTTRGRHR